MDQFSDIGQNSSEGVSNVRVSGQFLKKENCHNSRASNDNDLKDRPLNKLNKKTHQRKKKKKKNDDIILKNYNAIVIFPIYGQF